jgi:hypothetical protein
MMATDNIDLAQYVSTDDVFACDWTVEDVDDEAVGSLTSRFTFSFERPAAETWKHLKDFNAWMHDLDWDCVVGDAPEGATISFALAEEYHARFKEAYGLDGKRFRKYLTVKCAAPGKILVHEELSSTKRDFVAHYVTLLHEEGGRTTVTYLGLYPPQWVPQSDKEQLRAGYKTYERDVGERWKTGYIPRLRHLVEA